MMVYAKQGTLTINGKTFAVDVLIDEPEPTKKPQPAPAPAPRSLTVNIDLPLSPNVVRRAQWYLYYRQRFSLN